MFYHVGMKNLFSKRVRELRAEKGLSQKQLAERIKVSERTVSYWENGARECDFDTLWDLADFFEASVDFLLGRVEY